MKSTECPQTAVDSVKSADEAEIEVAGTPNTGELIARSEGRCPVGANTKIEWCDFTFNPWRGCQKVAPGCANCYAEAQSKRNPKVLGIWGPNGSRVVASEKSWRELIKWDQMAKDGVCSECKGKGKVSVPCCERDIHGKLIEENRDLICNECHGTGQVGQYRVRVFCASLADVFEDWQGQISDSRGKSLVHGVRGWIPCVDEQLENASGVTLDDVRARLFRLIDATPNLDWLLLTKRPENIRRMLPRKQDRPDVIVDGKTNIAAWHRENVWIGTSIACQEDADRNIPELLKCSDLCAKTFLSIEPLVGPVDLDEALVDWVIVGGESGPHARPCDVAWIRSIVEQCDDADVPVFVKQLGEQSMRRVHGGPAVLDGGVGVDRVSHMFRNKFVDRKGGDPAEWPEDLRVREVPT